MKKRTDPLLIGTGLAAATLCIAGTAHAAMLRFLVDVALEREPPRHPLRAGQRLSGTAIDPGLLAKIQSASAALRRRGPLSVTITAGDGTVLAGHWLPHPNARRVIIAMHGWRSSWDHDFGVISAFWHAQGCSVLYAEQRGQGQSGGERMGFGLLERHDCPDWIQWVNRQTGGKLPVYLAGISMGASTVLMAAELPLPENVRGIMADCGFTSPAAIWEHVARENLGLHYGIYRRAARGLCRKKLHLNIDEASCPKALSRSRVPVLFVHGTDDHFVPIDMTYENYKACAAPRYLHIVPGAEHGMSYFYDQTGCEKAMTTFWAQCERT